MSWLDVLLSCLAIGAAAVAVRFFLQTRQTPLEEPAGVDLEGQIFGQRIVDRVFDGACSGYRGEQNGQPSLLLRLQDPAAPPPTPVELQAFMQKWHAVQSPGLIPMVQADARTSGLWIQVPWTEARPWKRRSGDPLPTRIGRATSLLEALEALHERHVVHGRVTPVWMLIDDAQVLLMPPAPIHRDPRQLQTLHSSALYMPPEELKGMRTETLESDQYGAGITVALLLEAEQIYKRQGDFMGLLQSKLDPRFNLRFPEPVPDPVHDVIKRMLAPRPEERYPSVRDARLAFIQASAAL